MSGSRLGAPQSRSGSRSGVPQGYPPPMNWAGTPQGVLPKLGREHPWGYPTELGGTQGYPPWTGEASQGYAWTGERAPLGTPSELGGALWGYPSETWGGCPWGYPLNWGAPGVSLNLETNVDKDVGQKFGQTFWNSWKRGLLSGQARGLSCYNLFLHYATRLFKCKMFGTWNARPLDRPQSLN